MPRLQSIDLDPVDVDADGIAQTQTPGAAGNFTLNGALISGGTYTNGDGGARQLSFTSDGDESGDTYTVTGTDADGNAITEAVTGPGATTVESSSYFATVSQIATSGAGTGNITIGVVDEVVSKTFKLNRHATTGALVSLTVTGTINADIEVLAADPDDYTAQASMPWVDTSTAALVGATGSVAGNIDTHAVALRLIINSFSSGAEIQAYISQGYK